MAKGIPIKVQVDSRVMIDANLFREANPNYASQKVEQSNIVDLSDVFSFDSSESHARDVSVVEVHQDPSRLQEEDLMRCSPTMPGFSFENKMWLEFAISTISDIVWQSSVFDLVALPQDQKDIILSLAEVHSGHLDTIPFDDVISGKGRGLNILLHGPPGTGKTLTAEAIAETLKRPLYSISAAELGTTPEDIDNCLTQTFRLVQR